MKLVGERITLGRELERARVDAVAQAGRRRAVGKDVTLMGAAARADDLCPDRAVASARYRPLGGSDTGRVLSLGVPEFRWGALA
jgi:hypothetical protein